MDEKVGKGGRGGGGGRGRKWCSADSRVSKERKNWGRGGGGGDAIISSPPPPASATAALPLFRQGVDRPTTSVRPFLRRRVRVRVVGKWRKEGRNNPERSRILNVRRVGEKDKRKRRGHYIFSLLRPPPPPPSLLAIFYSFSSPFSLLVVVCRDPRSEFMQRDGDRSVTKRRKRGLKAGMTNSLPVCLSWTKDLPFF